MSSPIVNETARQIRALGIPHKRLLAKDDLTLRVHQKRNGFVFNTDITYDTLRDLYDVTVYKLDMRQEIDGAWNEQYALTVAERSYEGAYFDQLGELVGKTA